MLQSQSILITGGTGSFGKKFVETVLNEFPHVKRLVVYSRDELKQFEMSQQFPREKYPAIRYFIGDVRDLPRLKRACEDIDTIVHAAALKQVPTAEYNPIECIKTNILGAENVILSAIESNVKNVIALSTDKAAAPINLYGATKLCSDKLFIAANNMKGNRNLKFSIVRYGNVMGSRGSVIPLFLKQKKQGVLRVTHKDMTRFNISLKQGVNFVLKALAIHNGGEIFVPKIPSYRILDVAAAIAPECKVEIIGIRPGEKLHEEMITETDSYHTLEFKDYFVIVPPTPQWDPNKVIEQHEGNWVTPGFNYSSSNNSEWLSIENLQKLIEDENIR